MTTKANCLECGAKCAVHQLHCEQDVMKGKKVIDCQTFKQGKEETRESQVLRFAALRSAIQFTGEYRDKQNGGMG